MHDPITIGPCPLHQLFNVCHQFVRLYIDSTRHLTCEMIDAFDISTLRSNYAKVFHPYITKDLSELSKLGSSFQFFSHDRENTCFLNLVLDIEIDTHGNRFYRFFSLDAF